MPTRHWLLKLVPRRGTGKLLTGIAVFTCLYPLFRLGVSDDPGDSTPALFFSLVIAYINPVFSYITEKAEEAMVELRPLLNLDESTFEHTYSRLSGAGPWRITLQLVSGAFLGMIHWASLEGSFASALSGLTSSINGLMSSVGTLLTWMVMTSVIFMLVQQAVVFGELTCQYHCSSSSRLFFF